MMHYRFLILVCLLGLLVISPRQAQAGEEERQRAVVHAFLTHYFRQEFPKVRAYLPSETATMFGPYPFVEMPTLAKAKVDRNQALVEFSGEVIDQAFLPRGGLLLYREQGTWKVRQVLFYERIPALFRLPAKSVTAEDRRQEKAVSEVAGGFLTAWKRCSMEELRTRWYAWPQRVDDPIAGLVVGKSTMILAQTRGKEPCARYTIKLTYKWGVLSYTMDVKGRVLLTQEGEDWKVRGNVLIFDF